MPNTNRRAASGATAGAAATETPTIRRPSGASRIATLATTFVLLVAAGSAAAQCDGSAWTANLGSTATVKSAGSYQDNVAWSFETFSALELEPSDTAVFSVVSGIGSHTLELKTTQRLVVRDPKPGLAPNDPGADPFYVRREGAISATGWVDQEHCDLVVEGDVNSEGGPGGLGSSTRQGLLARWDKGNNFYWFYLNFASGEYAIWRSKHLGEQITLPGSVGTVPAFDSTRPYRLRFRLSGPTLRGTVFAHQDGGLVKVGDTGDVVDPEPILQGVSGVLAELAMERPFTTLEASFANLSATPLPGLSPAPVNVLEQARRTLEVRPASYTALYELAAALDECGDASGALARYEQVLEVYPDHVPSLNGKAWLLATASDATLRSPAAAVDLALEAFNRALQSNNTRHDARVQTVYSRSYLVELAYTLAAAYAAADIYDPIDPIVSGDTDASSAVATTAWALEIAQDVDAQRSTSYSQGLVDYGERALAAYTGKAALYGERRPGSATGVGRCGETPIGNEPVGTTTVAEAEAEVPAAEGL